MFQLEFCCFENLVTHLLVLPCVTFHPLAPDTFIGKHEHEIEEWLSNPHLYISSLNPPCEYFVSGVQYLEPV